MSVTPKRSWPWVKTMLHSNYDQTDGDAVHVQLDRMINALKAKLPAVAENLETTRAQTSLSSPRFPRRFGSSSVATIPSNSLIVRSGAGPTSSASFPIKPRSFDSLARS